MSVIDVPGIFRTPTYGVTTKDDMTLVQNMLLTRLVSVICRTLYLRVPKLGLNCKRAGLAGSDVRRICCCCESPEAILLGKALTIRDPASACKRGRDV